ncbi:MAG: oxidoreductase [Erysipelotrichia bacterium]|nr:oxidoreductase [Erysipelotrichia bacterium]
MKQTAKIISTYTADVSGVASALFELGGMTVIHDASGCNSTYNTHDEPRWYSQDSLVFVSGLSEMDAILGSDEKLVNDIIDAAEQLKPKFIAIAGTPIPMMIGTDLNAIAREAEDATGIPSFGLSTNSMHSYINGVSMAFKAIAERFIPKDCQRDKGSLKVNVIGVTPLDYSINGSDQSMRTWLNQSGFTVQSMWAMGSTLEELSSAGNADISLVTSYDGLAAAKYLYETYQIPYVVGSPIGSKFARILVSKLMDASKNDQCYIACIMRSQQNARIVIIGESVYSGSLAAAIEQEYQIPCRIICPLETDSSFLAMEDAEALDEDEIIPLLKNAGIVIADPLYEPIVPSSARFQALPAESFSGRIYRQDIPNLINHELKEKRI